MSLPAPDPSAVALVTGASSGLGAEFARQLGAAGHGVALVARRAERLEQLAAEVREAHGVRAEVLECDLTDPPARAGLPGRLDALGLRADVLVNNAGFATGGPFHESDLDQELQQVRLLCEAPVDLMGRFLPAMVARGAGCVINVASTAGMQPLPNSAGYGAAKAHLLSLSEAVHAEVRKHAVTITALCPGPVRTELFDKTDHPVEMAPGFAWKDSDEVVAAALDGARRGKRVVVPGAVIRAAVPVSRFAPRAVSLPLFERFFR
ncbi:SDR family oxidoreductase [Conexibacter sp. SYSU D00693]|uniref:SDR family NAD(P)-dependent oxidoreductase n=1 Tax=Conexibacter sp. SYSU D00693 TaxID=2812560 RepID=UPI00196A3AE4|nr:SDR family oxidoreductase [Conexibacter sp. SYSU D00693]